MSPLGPVLRSGPDLRPGDTTDKPLELVERLVAGASDEYLVASVQERVARFRRGRLDERQRALPGLYLLLEHYLTQIDPNPVDASALRDQVRDFYPNLLEDPRFALVFAPEDQQEIMLCGEFLRPLLERSLALLGDRAHPSLKAVATWLDRLENLEQIQGKPSKSSPADSVEGSPTREGWATLLGRLGHDLYDRLKDLLGAGVARSLFEQQYMDVAEDYLGLSTFPAVVRLFPPEILDERKLSLLTRSQTRQVLLEKLEELQRVNHQLEESNADLQMALEVLERSNEELESRVAERTAALERANQETQASEERLRRISESARDGILMVDYRGRTSYMNGAAESMLGGDRKDLLGKPILRTVVPQRFRSKLDQAFREALATGDGPGLGQTRELMVQRRDGSELPVELSMSSVKHLGNWHLVAIVRDISQRKSEDEERQRLAEKLQEAQRLESLGALTGGIAHDFNNLLTAILGHAGLMDELVPRDFPLRGSIKEIRNAGQRLADITQQLHAYSGSGRFLVEPVRIGDLVAEMAELLRTSVSKKAQLDFRFEHDLPAVMGDRGQLQQVIVNLITNASEALEEGDGEVCLSASVVDVDLERLEGFRHGAGLSPGRFVMIEVTDTGAGITSEIEAKMFEPFFSSRFAGRGLGLAAVSGIVRGHQGGIELETRVGEGTSIRIFLPASESIRNAPTQEIEFPGLSSVTGTVLVVDDEAPVRILAQQVLEEFGFEVMTAEDGLQAVDTYRRLGPSIDLILLDLTMPNMDGEQALRAIQALDPEVKVLLSSGYSRNETMKRFQGCRLSGFVAKPYEMQELLWEVRLALSEANDSQNGDIWT